MPLSTPLPKLPDLVEQKLTKAGYTRGATKRDIYQNRVTRNNTVLIELANWQLCRTPDDGTGAYEQGFIVVVDPDWYFTNPESDDILMAAGLKLGTNALLLFRKRIHWNLYAPKGVTLPNGMPFQPANSRVAPLGGTYFARIHATVTDPEIVEGYNTTQVRGAGIRVYEYASTPTIVAARIQLEVLMWHCYDANRSMEISGMTPADISARRSQRLTEAAAQGLLDYGRLQTLRMVNEDRVTICPLCREPMSAADFLKRAEQAEGREVHDLTMTEVSLFHVQELRVGKSQHKPYNLGWGHYFCNTVVRDAGIVATLLWMQRVLANQGSEEDFASEIKNAVEG